MAEFPGFPCNGYAFHFEDVGPALAGLIVRDINGNPRAGLLTSRPDVLRTRADWSLDSDAFVAVRAKGRAVLLGGSTDVGLLDITTAPAANARLDVIWTRPADVDAGEVIAGLQVTNGVPSAVPVKPGIPEGAVEVATLRVPSNATSTQDCILTMTFASTACAGGILPFRTTALMNSWPAVPGQLAMVNDSIYQRIGTTWRMEMGDTGWIPLVLRNGFSGVAYIKMKNGNVSCRGAIIKASLGTSYEEFADIPTGVTPPLGNVYSSLVSVSSGLILGLQATPAGKLLAATSSASASARNITSLQYTA